MYKQFQEDLVVGNKYEALAQERIIKFYGDDNGLQVIETCNNYKYDFRLSNDMTYEVKFERASLKTGNVFIEYMAFNKPSGIVKTLADYFIIVLPIDDIENQYVLVDVDVIKKLIAEKLYTREHIDKYKSGYIFMRAIIIECGILI